MRLIRIGEGEVKNPTFADHRKDGAPRRLAPSKGWPTRQGAACQQSQRESWATRPLQVFTPAVVPLKVTLAQTAKMAHPANNVYLVEGAGNVI
jgi:hypothetical protein